MSIGLNCRFIAGIAVLAMLPVAAATAGESDPFALIAGVKGRVDVVAAHGGSAARRGRLVLRRLPGDACV
jgi:hypothetical protein